MTTTDTHNTYQVASKDAVTALHNRFLARQDGIARAALATVGTAPAVPVLYDLALEVLMHAARMRVNSYSQEQLARLLDRAANSNDPRRIVDRHKDELTMAAALRERLASPRFGAAVVPADDMKLINDAAAIRVRDERLEKIFDGEDRIYLAMNPAPTDAQKEIAAALAKMPPVRAGDPAGYRISDWSKGYATDHAGKQSFRIGKLLREHAPALAPAFENRTTDNLMIVVSRRPDDIARASTNRGWHSCAGAGRGDRGAYDKLANGVKEGLMIAYLVSDSDPDINDPLARVMLYPFIKDKVRDKRFGFAPKKSAVLLDKLGRVFAAAAGKTVSQVLDRIWYVGKNYGLNNPDFTGVINAFVEAKLNSGGKGCYWLPYDVYHDGVDVVVRDKGTTTVKHKFHY